MTKSIYLFTFALILLINTAHAQWTEQLLPGLQQYPQMVVYGLCSDPTGNIYAAGTFTNPSNHPFVAKLTDSTWTEVAGQDSLNANGPIYALTTDAGGNIYAAGRFTDSPASNFWGNCYVAKYNGTTWSSLGPIPNSSNYYCIQCICIDPSGNVYAAGKLLDTSTQQYYVAKYNGTSWSVLGGSNDTFFNEPIYALYSDALGNIYAGGNFTNPSGKQYIAKYNGTAWSELGGANALAANGDIQTIIGDAQQHIYVAGAFQNNSAQAYIAQYDGSSWSQIGGSLGSDPNGGAIYALCLDQQNNLYAGGNVNDSLGGPTYISKYNGTSWNRYNNFAAPYGNRINAICLSPSGELYAGGLLWDDSINRYYVAQFSNPTGIQEIKQTNSLKISPNPSNNLITISSGENLSNATMRLTNITGQTVIEKTNQSGTSFTLDISAQPAGMYFISVQQQGSSWAGKVVKVD